MGDCVGSRSALNYLIITRAVGIHPNKLIGVVGEHEDFPIEAIRLSGGEAGICAMPGTVTESLDGVSRGVSHTRTLMGNGSTLRVDRG